MPKCYGRPRISYNSSAVPDHSKPLPDEYMYSVDWATAVYPNDGRKKLLDEVNVYYGGRHNCCVGWQKMKPKQPVLDGDIDPFKVPLCGNANRRVVIYIQYTREFQ